MEFPFLKWLWYRIASHVIHLAVLASKKAFLAEVKLYSEQNLSLSIILKIFLKFGSFQPRYSYIVYSYKKRVIVHCECQLSNFVHVAKCDTLHTFAVKIGFLRRHSGNEACASFAISHECAVVIPTC